MSGRRVSRINRCKKCHVTKNLCFCRKITPVTGSTEIKIIMHFRERWLTSNSAHMFQMIYSKTKIFERGKREDPIWEDVLFQDGGTPLFLFPDKDAVPLERGFLDGLCDPYLIVPDGSWTQAKKIKRRVPCLNDVQSVFLPVKNQSQYYLRRQQGPIGLSTFEAISFSLEYFEGKELKRELLNNFEIMIRSHLKARSGDFRPDNFDTH